jgi:hypothetical protein
LNPLGHLWTVIKCAADPTLRMRERLDGRQMQTGLHCVSVEQVIILPSCYGGQPCQISEHRSRAILPIQAQKDLVLTRGDAL